jgi:hypothetical protein
MKFVEHMHVLFQAYHNWSYAWGIRHCYPSLELLRFVGETRIKYKDEQLLSKIPVKDKRAWELWGEIVEVKGESKRGEAPLPTTSPSLHKGGG